MEVKSEVLVKLICNNCKGYLSVGPVLLLQDGNSVCGRCSVTDEQPTIRMLPYEHLAADMLFPCQYQSQGCTEKQSFSTLKVHEANCKCKPYSCPLLAGNCGWSGLKEQLLQHCKDTHPGQVVENGSKFQYDITATSVRDFLMAAFNVLFLIHTKVCLQTEKIYHCVRLLAHDSHTKDYDFTLDIFNETNNVSKKGHVAPHECLTQIEIDSLAVSIHSLIEFLGGYTGMTFKLTVNSLIKESSSERKCTQMAKPKNKPNQLNCDVCNTNITHKVAYFMHENEWLCSDCIGYNKKCEFKNRGCTFTDTAPKIAIHSQFYCKYRKICDICDLSFRGSLDEHYPFAHFDITYTAGVLWTEQVSRDAWKDLIINSNVGRLHCEHRLHNSQFKFNVCSSIPDGSLHFYTCRLDIENPATGKTFSTDLLYNEEYDWRIKIDESDFMEYAHENTFKISLTIHKTK